MANSTATTSRRLGLIVCTASLLAGCGKKAEETNATPATTAPPAATAAAAPDCAPSGTLNYVCGLKNAEDMVPLGNSDWLIVSGLSPLGQPVIDQPGRIYLLNRVTKAHEEWFPATTPSVQHDKQTFGDCPGPLDTRNFSPHGLALREQAPDRYRLYITSHGGREAIEVFDIDAAGERPAIVWAGCVMLPEKTLANSVAILADGGFVTTKFMDPSVPNPFAAITAGSINGEVYEWHPGGKVTAIAGTELSGANGIELSPDQRYLFVAAFGSREIVRFDRNAKPITRQSVKIDVAPDNLRWSPSGKLYTTGGKGGGGPGEHAGWSVYEIDPQSLQATRIADVDHTAALQGASTALPVGDQIWIGTYTGDRVAYMAKP